MSASITPAVLTTEQASQYLNIPVATLVEWRTTRRKGSGPKFARLAKSIVRYRITDLDAWLAANVREGV